MRNSQQKTTITLWNNIPPISTDPLKYDSVISHLVFRSVMSSLVSQYKTGEYKGVLAQSWMSSQDAKQWQFTIRDHLYFENGDPITPELIRRSLMRMAFLQRQRHSQNGLLEHLIGFQKVKSPQSTIDGLKASGNSILFTFDIPMPKLLDTISFGLYAAVHPNDYDEKTGVWKNSANIISSGPYRIQTWTDDHLVLSLRSEFPAILRHPKPISEIKVVWAPELRNKADIVAGFSNENDLKPMTFQGSVASAISYLFCHSWSHPSSIFFDLHRRRALRKLVYEGFHNQRLGPIRSFFPLSIRDVKELSDPNQTLGGTPKLQGIVKYNETKRLNPWYLAYNQVLKNLSANQGVKTEAVQISMDTVFAETAPNLPQYSLDLSLRFTSVLVDDPIADIRFMFLSKEGIRLPDADGRIHTELEKPTINIQRINEILWDQAIVWPLTHFALGLWSRDDLDFSMINLVLPPTDFSWIGWK